MDRWMAIWMAKELGDDLGSNPHKALRDRCLEQVSSDFALSFRLRFDFSLRSTDPRGL
jgi:hypothetical protein